MSLPVYGQEITGVRTFSLGGISSTHGEAWDNNPAALGLIQTNIISSYCTNSWFIKELSGSALSFSYKGKQVSAGFYYHYSGFSALRRQNAGLGIGRQFGDRFCSGIRFTYSSYAIAGYGFSQVISAQAGFINRLNKVVALAAFLQNIGNPGNSLYESNPLRIRIGLRYDSSPRLRLYAEADQQLSRPLNIRGALEYEVNETFVLRGGFSSDPGSIAFGLGLNLKSFQCELSNSYYQYLGFRPAIGLSYAL